MSEAPENRTGRPTTASTCRGRQPTRRRFRGRVRGLPGPAAPIAEIRNSARRSERQALCPGRSSSRARDCGMLPRPPCLGNLEEKSLARRGQRQTSARRTAPRNQRRVRDHDDVMSVLARAREVEAAAQRGRVTPAVRTKFQVVALLVREERARVRAADRQRRSPDRAAQAPRRHRDDPGEDRRPGHLAAGAARRGRRRLRRGPVAQAGDAAGPRHRAGRRRRSRPPRPRPSRRLQPAGRAAVGRLAAAGQPLPRPRLLGRPPSAPPVAPPAGQLGAARPAAQLVRARRRRSPGVHGAARPRRAGPRRAAWS